MPAFTGSSFIRERRKEVESAFTCLGDASKKVDSQAAAHLGRYLAIRVAGYLEQSTNELIRTMARQRSDTAIQRYINGRFAKSNNYKSTKLLDLLAEFSEDWKTKTESYINSNGRREAIDSIYATRHSAAHGGQSGMTIATARGYFDKVDEVVKHLEKQLISSAKKAS